MLDHDEVRMSGHKAERSGPGRPRASSREDIERVAIELFLERGYSAVKVDEIAQECGISRRTFFGYFPSKGRLVWSEFEDALRILKSELNRASAVSVLDAVLEAVAVVAEQTLGARADRATIARRFQLFESSDVLRGEAARQSAELSALIARFVASRSGLEATSPAPETIAAAVMGCYTSTLRQWSDPENELRPVGEVVRESLTAVCAALTPYLDAQVARTA
ncbi:acyl-CoA-like ligand-binding transcription factor [Nocardia sp. NPDC055029]